MSRPSAAGWGHPTRPEHERGRQRESSMKHIATCQHYKTHRAAYVGRIFKHLDPRLHCNKLTGTDQLTTSAILVVFLCVEHYILRLATC